jgi:hypothetical protein
MLAQARHLCALHSAEGDLGGEAVSGVPRVAGHDYKEFRLGTENRVARVDRLREGRGRREDGEA